MPSDKYDKTFKPSKDFSIGASVLFIIKRTWIIAIFILLTFIITSLFIEHQKSNRNIPETNSNSNSNLKPLEAKDNQIYDSRFDHLAFALKTGKDVALKRTPIQLLTFLSNFKNKIIIGEAPGVFIGDIEMIDVYTDLYSNKTTIPRIHKRLDDSSSIADENSLGWKSDAHKNFPGFKQLYARFPDAKWFIMLDDDTYIFKENLVDLLKTYNPDLPHYLGISTVFKGCDGVRNFGDGPAFAHGGSGIVMSRGALKIMLKIVDSCIIKYKECWAGDIRVALCLRDAGILLKDPGGFNTNPPNEKFSFDDKPCRKPITFHHLTLEQLQSLASLENRILKGPGNRIVTMADIFLNSRKNLPDIQFDSDRKGWDLTSIKLGSYQECLTVCMKHKSCFSFVYTGGKCWLKEAIPAANDQKESISGVIPSKYKCPY